MGFFSKKNYASEWINMSQDAKNIMIKNNFTGFLESYVQAKHITNSPQDNKILIETIKQSAIEEGWFSKFTKEITEGYNRSKTNKSPNKVVRSFVSNYIKSYLNLLEKQSKSGCLKCGNLTFEYDNYYNEYTCDNCGWITSEKPNGEIINPISPKENDSKNTSSALSPEKVNEIINKYGGLISSNNAPAPNCVADEQKLPYPKNIIKSAIIMALQNCNDPETLNALKNGYLQLSSWQQGVGENTIGLGLVSNPGETPSPEKVLEMLSSSNDFLDRSNQEYESLKKELEELNLY